MGSANTDYSVFNAMAAQMTNDKMDSKFEEIVRVMLEQNNLPDKTINDLKILAKKGVSTKTTTELKKSDLPRDLNCGKYTIEQVRRKAAELHIPSHMVIWIDPKDSESVFYIANFWHYDRESIYRRLCLVKAATVKDSVEGRYDEDSYSLNKLPCVYTDNFKYKPDYQTFRDGYPPGLESLGTYDHSEIETINIDINKETQSFDKNCENLSAGDSAWFPYLVLAHSSTTRTVTNREIENCVGKNQYDEVDWLNTIDRFITTAMKYRLSRDTKANIFKDIVKKYAKECAFWISSKELPDVFLTMANYRSHLTQKDRSRKQLYNFVRLTGQQLKPSIEFIFEHYKIISFEHVNISYQLGKDNFSGACEKFMVECLCSLIKKDLAEHIMRKYKASQTDGFRISVDQLISTVQRWESEYGPPMEAMPLYTVKDSYNINNVAWITGTHVPKEKNTKVMQISVPNGQGRPYYTQDPNDGTWGISNMPRLYVKTDNGTFIDYKVNNMPSVNNGSGLARPGFDTPPPPGDDSVIYNNLNSSPTPDTPLSSTPKIGVPQGGSVGAGLNYYFSPSNTEVQQEQIIPETSNYEVLYNNNTQSEDTVTFRSPSQAPQRGASISSGHKSIGETETVANIMSIKKVAPVVPKLDPWAKAMKIIESMKKYQVNRRAFTFESVIDDDFTDNQYIQYATKFQTEDRFLQLGADIFSIIGFPDVPYSMTTDQVHDMLKQLDKVHVPLFYKYIFFNCPCLSPVFHKIKFAVNKTFSVYKGHWCANGLPVMSLTTENSSRNRNDRSSSRGRIVEGRYVSNQPRERPRSTTPTRQTESGERGRTSDRRAYRSPSVSSVPRTRTNNNYSSSEYLNKSRTPERDNKLSGLTVQYDGFRQHKCKPRLCPGNCENKDCKKCGGNHSTHNCGFYGPFSRTPCSTCTNLFHFIGECQKTGETFPKDTSKNA